jgi:hypothetical protein
VFSYFWSLAKKLTQAKASIERLAIKPKLVFPKDRKFHGSSKVAINYRRCSVPYFFNYE